MPFVTTCKCGHALSPGDDWVGSSALCPACGAEVELPTRRGSSPSRAAWTCLVFGSLAIILYLDSFADLPNQLLPRTISRTVEDGRTQNGYLAAMIAAMIGLGAAWFSRFERSAIRPVGLICASLSLGMLFLQSVNLAGSSRHLARRAQCVNNLKQITLALANYESRYGAYPPRVSRDRQGRPLLSWRVTLLPFLEQNELYEKFHLDEPWDSPHNLTLIDRIPSPYVCPGQAAWTHPQTFYQTLDGPRAFLNDLQPTRIGDITDGLGETLSVVEGPSPVPWTSPRDVPFRSDQPFPAWEATHPGGFNAAFVNGSVRFLKSSIKPATLQALCTKDGGEVVSIDSY